VGTREHRQPMTLRKRASACFTCTCNAAINVKLLEGRPGIGGGFELGSVFLFKCRAPGKSSWVKKVHLTPVSEELSPESKELNE